MILRPTGQTSRAWWPWGEKQYVGGDI